MDRLNRCRSESGKTLDADSGSPCQWGLAGRPVRWFRHAGRMESPGIARKSLERPQSSIGGGGAVKGNPKRFAEFFRYRFFVEFERRLRLKPVL